MHKCKCLFYNFLTLKHKGLAFMTLNTRKIFRFQHLKKNKLLFQIGFQVHFQWPVFDFKLNFDLRPSTVGFKFSDVPSDVIKHLLTVTSLFANVL